MIAKAIESLPKSIPCFLLSYKDYETNKNIASMLKQKRPLSILVAVSKYDDIGEYAKAQDRILYDLRLDCNLILHNSTPEQFESQYDSKYGMKFARIFTDKSSKTLKKMLGKDGRIIKM